MTGTPASAQTRSVWLTVSMGNSSWQRTSPAEQSRDFCWSMNAEVTLPLAPGTTTMLFSPVAESDGGYTGRSGDARDGSGVDSRSGEIVEERLAEDVFTDHADHVRRDSRGVRRRRPGLRLCRRVWWRNLVPMRVWPARGMAGVRATRSMLMLPTTTIGFVCGHVMSSCVSTSGASAIAPSPSRKKMNMKTRSIFAERGAPANSRQTKTPQHAETMVAPWPME